jgi:predicted phosphodiesterase
MKMGKKIMFIGDIHGVPDWEQIAKDALKQFYEIVFLGDYVDSFHVKTGEQLYNLNNICIFARKNKERVTLLLGNHDYAYIYNHPGISGHQYHNIHDFKKMFQDNIDLFQMAWGYTNPNTKKYTLATHAGLTARFWNHFLVPETKEGGFVHKITEGKEVPIHEVLNYLQDKDLLWKVGSARGGSGTPGILWADYTEVLEDRLEGINQIFGHTPQPSVRVDQFDGDMVACIDSWGNKKASSLLITL